jgi:hypothetical protein
VQVGAYGTFTMRGGEISDNTGTAGGGVVLLFDGTFTMQNGIISGNTAQNGGGIVVGGHGTFIMAGGEIFRNSAREAGGGVLVNYYGTFIMRGGEISRNTAQDIGNGVAIFNEGTFTMSGEARVHTDNAISLYYYDPSDYRSIGIEGDFTGPAGPVAKIELIAPSDPASNWPGKAILKPAGNYGGTLTAIRNRFSLGNFIHTKGAGTAESPYTFPTVPITGYELGADGRLETSGQ